MPLTGWLDSVVAISKNLKFVDKKTYSSCPCSCPASPAVIDQTLIAYEAAVKKGKWTVRLKVAAGSLSASHSYGGGIEPGTFGPELSFLTARQKECPMSRGGYWLMHIRGRGDLVVTSRLTRPEASGSKHGSSKDPPCIEKAKSYVAAKRPPVGVVQKYSRWPGLTKKGVRPGEDQRAESRPTIKYDKIIQALFEQGQYF
ncbi:hypothetical protein AVEN_34096-1 [Araneus ventricosus]|uniref:Uncharacterized protein n=1 Tax=Araneus ventricosus TaxID=182803 RepID=A0A4Y2RI05_ARAVE|nr:hypothetical protein AVEN_34096-1 [Araneus ventricosus]